jgi:hypothetical protein
MKFQWTWILGTAAVCAASGTAWGQYGPASYSNHGSPSLLPLPQVSARWDAPAQQTPAARPATFQPPTTNHQPPTTNYPAYAQLQPPMPPTAAEEVNAGQPSAAADNQPSPSDAPRPYGDPYDVLGPSSDLYKQALNGSGWGEDCVSCLPAACQRPVWFGGLYGLVMTRDNANPFCFSYDTNKIDYQPLTSRSIDNNWQGGFEVRAGRMIGGLGGACGTGGCHGGACYGLEAVYWGLYNNTQQAQVWASDVSGQLATTPTFNNLNFGLNNVANDCTLGAQSYRLRTNWQAQNVELNLIRFGAGGACASAPCCGPYGIGSAVRGGAPGLCLSGALGARFLRFDDGFLFASSKSGDFTDLNQVARYNVDVENYLVGAQLGARADYYSASRWSLFGGIKFGIYGNYMTGSQYVADGLGNYATINNGPNSGMAWNMKGHKKDVSFLGEVRLGGAYQISQHWRAVASYRAVAVTGIALSTNQVPDNFGDYYGARNIDSNGSLILHGVQMGAEFVY